MSEQVLLNTYIFDPCVEHSWCSVGSHGATTSLAHEILIQLQGAPGVLPAAGVMLYIRPVLQIYSFQELCECLKHRS